MINCLYEPFRHWSMMGAVYLISDTHFDDSDTKLMDENWPEPEEYIRFLKKIVTQNDTIVHLGDVGNPAYMDELPGYKVLILGNHDSRKACQNYFHEIYDGPLFISRKIILSHEPLPVECAVNIHGHSHRETFSGLRFTGENAAHVNLAGDVCGYVPMNLGKEIKRGLLSGIRDIHRATIDKAVNAKDEFLDFGIFGDDEIGAD